MNTERDRNNQMEFAKRQGLLQGYADARKATARNLLKMGLAPKDISEATELSVEEIEALKD